MCVDDVHICSCDFCGLGLGEVKCPYCIEGKDFDSYDQKQSSCLEKIGSEFVLKRSHSYYSQVQQQLHNISDRVYCDFIVCAIIENEFVQLVQERITPDHNHWEEQLPKLSLFWRICIIPEIMGRWYTRKLVVQVHNQ